MIDDDLYDPSAVLDLALSWLTAHALQLAIVIPTAVVVTEAIESLLLRLRHRALTNGARCVEILAPPIADMPGAETLWSNLMGLLRPAWKRVLFGQLHLAFEYVFGVGGVRIRLWVPGTVPSNWWSMRSSRPGRPRAPPSCKRLRRFRLSGGRPAGSS